jgi:hypothetical protein
MSIPVSYDLSKFAEMGDPEDWLDDELEVELGEECQGFNDADPSLFNISEEQVDDPNFWINL